MRLSNVWTKKKEYFDFCLIRMWISFSWRLSRLWMNLTLSSTVSIKSTNSTHIRQFQALNLIIVVRQPIHVMCIPEKPHRGVCDKLLTFSLSQTYPLNLIGLYEVIQRKAPPFVVLENISINTSLSALHGKFQIFFFTSCFKNYLTLGIYPLWTFRLVLMLSQKYITLFKKNTCRNT